MNGTELKEEEEKQEVELKEEEAGFSLGGCCGEEERPPVVDCHLTKEQGIPPWGHLSLPGHLRISLGHPSHQRAHCYFSLSGAY